MTKKTRIRTGIVLVVVCVMCFSDWSFAADKDDIGTMAWLINFIVNILSWIWVIFAKIAGEFLSNKWVYGEIIGLDAILWKYRNVVKNMANFALGFYFLYVIFTLLIKKTDVIKEVKDMLLWILIAGVGIQASRFVVAAMIDVSTITFVAAGTLPYQVISLDNGSEGGLNILNLKKSYEKNLEEFIKENTDQGQGKNGFIFSLFSKNEKAQSFTSKIPIEVNNEGKDLKGVMDSILPTAESMEGPLYYMGLVLLKSTEINSIDDSDKNGLKKAIIDAILQGGTTVVYSVEMMVLCVLAIMRVLYLWMFIVVSPFAVLLWCIGQSKSKGGPSELSFVKEFAKSVNFSSFFLNVFKPTIIALGISLTVIVVSLIRGVLVNDQNKPIDIGGVKVTTTTSATNNSNDDKSYNTSIESESFQFHFMNAAKSILEIFLSILTVVLTYMIIKMAVEMGDGSDFVSKRVKSLQNSVSDLITQTPIIPIGSYDEKGHPQSISIKSLGDLGNRKIQNKKNEYIDGSYKEMDDVMRMWGIMSEDMLTESQKIGIKQAGGVNARGMKKLEEMKKYIKDKKNKITGKGLKLDPKASDPFWRQEFEAWLEGAENENNITDPTWKNMVAWWNDSNNKSIRTLEEMFKKVDGSAGAYAKFFGFGDITTWTQLKDLDISG